MKQHLLLTLVAAASAVLSLPAHADVTMYAGKGTGTKIVGVYPTLEACVLAGNASTRKGFVCKVTVPPCPAKPADKVNICPLPSVGEWTSTAIAAPSPSCWELTPATAPAGACVVPPPVTPPTPPVDMTKTVAIDPDKVPKTVAAGSPNLLVKATTEVPAVGDGAFRTSCFVAKFGFIDPIVFPGQVGKSHLHVFFGNTGVDANSTAESLRTTGTSTCRGGIANRSSYWVPAMIDTKDGTPLVPRDIGTYYKAAKLDPSLIHPIPAGLRMIAGTPQATGPSPAFAERFKCIGGPNAENDKYGPTIGNCDVGARLISEVFFPQCWDGVNLDSPDHKSHMSYTITVRQPDGTSKRMCPTTHPVGIPEVTFNVEYVVTEKDAPLRWRLASDVYDKTIPGGYSSHGDWFNGWDSSISDAWAKNCVMVRKDCHSHLLGDGRMLSF